MLDWQFSRFDRLPIRDWYTASALRVDIFVLEQDCPFQDNDGADFDSWHLLGWHGDGASRTLAAYCRLVDPGIKFDEPSIGRVVTSRRLRRMGFGKVLMAEALRRHESLYPGRANRIGAQQRLERFYREFGYETVSKVYMEDGIPHVEMLRAPAKT
ncbi:MAG TPA: GNAT family N-acetyltransferase [Usitatibacteraceae bacterium]|nr:GNAT family N-acetyltransferase [Usitatibacteraceae bacterium]